MCPGPAICKNIPCINQCFGSGTCVKGVCQCYPGFSGIDCSNNCGSQCGSCNATVCLDCLGANMAIIPKTKTCVCNPGFYFNNITGNCDPPICSNLCGNCTKITCTTCVNNATLTAGLCSCKAGFYDCGCNSCAPCDPLCPTCNISQCLTCVAKAVPVNNTCMCSQGYFQNFSSCVACSVGCLNCTSLNNCLTFNSSYIPYLGGCALKCPNGTFPANGTCQSCPMPGCINCTNANNTCTSCMPQ